MENSNPNLLIDSATIGIDKPVAIFLGLSLSKKKRKYLEDEHIDLVVKSFQNEGINAARYDKIEAESPSALVITRTGLQTPFIPPDELQATVIQLDKIIDDISGISTYGYAHPAINDQLMEPVYDKNKLIDIENTHPNPDKVREILEKHGQNFISKMLEKAQSLPDAVLDDSFTYSGSSVPQPFLIAPRSENKAFIYGAVESKNASVYPHGDIPYSFIRRYEGKAEFNGFIGFDAEAEQRVGYPDYGLERGKKRISGDRSYEIPIYPGSHVYLGLILKMKDNQGNVLLKEIPETSPDWQDFIEINRPGYIDDNKHLLKRRANQKEQNNNETVYSLFEQMVRHQEQQQAEVQKEIPRSTKYEEITKIADLSGRSVESLIAAHQSVEQKNQRASGKEESKEKEAEVNDKDIGRQITNIRGLGAIEAKPVIKTTLDITKVQDKGHEK